MHWSDKVFTYRFSTAANTIIYLWQHVPETLSTLKLQGISLCVIYPLFANLRRFYLTAHTICARLLLIWMFYSKANQLSNELLEQEHVKEIVSEEVLKLMRGSYQTIWGSFFTNVKWNSESWPYRAKPSGLFTKPRPGNAHSSGHLAPPQWGLAYALYTCWDRSFSKAYDFSDFAIGTPEGTFSILLKFLCSWRERNSISV